ncbi:MAG TPA: exonuclease sbcCD subunit D [Clostridiales bacterium]|nr:exonuclease sbcCD subunit D [Clostridiales bacterium]
MKILHTSDWHLGRSLYNRKRYDEFAAFLGWLAETLHNEQIDTLLVAGDVFDTSTPSNRAQELYYQFLGRIAGSHCRHVVIIAGNHDSPSFLEAPKALLKNLNVHIIGEKPSDAADEVLVLKDRNGRPAAIVCAIPYLRDRDLRTVEAGESIEEKGSKLIDGLRSHYEEVVSIARQMRAETGDIPMIATGHLFAAGGQTVDGDGVRELYVGTLAQIGVDAFPPDIDYLALGHLHVPQKLGGQDHLRYSGSPLPMGFGEANHEKQVVIVDFNGCTMSVSTRPVPCFQPLARINGSLSEIMAKIGELQMAGSNAWLEIEYTGTEIITDLREQVDAALSGSAMECQRIKNRRVLEGALARAFAEETLDDLNIQDVFLRCLDQNEINEKEQPELISAYQEIVRSIAETDLHAE